MFAIVLPIFNPIAFSIYTFDIYWYSLAYIVGFYSVSYCATFLNRSTLCIVPHDIFHIGLGYIAFGIIIGGRLGHVMIYDGSYYWNNLGEVLKVWHGGMSFHGGLIGSLLGLYYLCRKYDVSVFDCADLIVPFVPIGLFLGRLANFVNGELYGTITSLPIAMVFPSDPMAYPRHPSQLYEAFLEGIVLLCMMLFFLYKTKSIVYRGKLLSIFLMLYAIIRFLVEYVRDDEIISLPFGIMLTIGQCLSILMFIVGFILAIKSSKQPRSALHYTQ